MRNTTGGVTEGTPTVFDNKIWIMICGPGYWVRRPGPWRRTFNNVTCRRKWKWQRRKTTQHKWPGQDMAIRLTLHWKPERKKKDLKGLGVRNRKNNEPGL